MKKIRYALLLLAVLLSLCFAAAAQTVPVVDEAGLLTQTEYTALTEELEHIHSDYGVDVVVVTAQSLYGQSAQTYADDYYDEHGYGADGVLLLVDMTERQWHISTAGRMTFIDVQELANTFLADLSDGQYYDAFITFAAVCEKAAYAEQDSEFVLTDSGGVSQRSNAKTVLICLVIGAAVGLVAVLIMKGQLKTVRSQNAASSYVVDGLQLTRSTDLFLYHTTTRRAKPQNNTTHRSSSGRSHGGGGGRF